MSSQPLSSTQPAAFNGMTLNPSGPGEWYNGFIYEYQYERNTSYSVSSEHGVINNAFTSIEGFDDIQPYTLLWVDPSYAYDSVISKSGTNFSWYPVVNNSLFEIIIAVYSSDGSQFLGAVSCLENDSGSMFIPGSYFQMYPSYAIAAVHLIRHRVDRVPVPELNEERRTELKKIIKSVGEKCKVSIRNIRREANEELKKLLKSKEIGEDQAFYAQYQEFKEFSKDLEVFASLSYRLPETELKEEPKEVWKNADIDTIGEDYDDGDD